MLKMLLLMLLTAVGVDTRRKASGRAGGVTPQAGVSGLQVDNATVNGLAGNGRVGPNPDGGSADDAIVHL
jgi:hypothetical protein